MKNPKRQIANVLLLMAAFGIAHHSFGKNVQEMPTPAELFERHVEALGGESTLRTHAYRTLVGKLTIEAMGIEGKMQIVAAAPNKLKTTVDLGQFGVNRSGFNGAVGWSMDPMGGNRVLSGAALKVMMATADFYSNSLHLGVGSTEVETVGTAAFDGGQHYRVLLVDEQGEETYLYFDKSSGLLSGIDRIEVSVMGPAPTQIRLNDYTEANGLQTALKIVTTQSGVVSVMSFDSISFEEIEPGAFSLPTEIEEILGE